MLCTFSKNVDVNYYKALTRPVDFGLQFWWMNLLFKQRLIFL